MAGRRKKVEDEEFIMESDSVFGRGDLSAELEPLELDEELSLRPKKFSEYIGQEEHIRNLKVYVTAAGQRGEALDHVLLSGPPGLGKTSLAHVIANELGVTIHSTSGPALEKKGDLAGLLTKLAERDVLFIDEIHRLHPAVEENLYPAMEDYEMDLVLDSGAHARSCKIPLNHFTLIGATTKSGMLTGPLRDRFGVILRLDYYSHQALETIVRRSADILQIPCTPEAAHEIATRSRGTPRIANRLLRRLRDFAQVEGNGTIDLDIATIGLTRLQVDKKGLDQLDHHFLLSIIDKFGGGPVGLDTLAAAIGEDKGTIEDVVEPYLIKEGYIQRTPRGRIAMETAYAHFGREMKSHTKQRKLF